MTEKELKVLQYVHSKIESQVQEVQSLCISKHTSLKTLIEGTRESGHPGIGGQIHALRIFVDETREKLDAFEQAKSKCDDVLATVVTDKELTEALEASKPNSLWVKVDLLKRIKGEEETVKAWVNSSLDQLGSCLTNAELTEKMEERLQILSQDDLGIKDYALNQNGATVIKGEGFTSQVYLPEDGSLLLTLGHWMDKVTGRPSGAVGRPEDAISSLVSHGQCFPFPGDKGNLTVRLGATIRPEQVSLEHISKIFSDNEGSSALRDFSVWGYQSIEALQAGQAHLLVEGTYDINGKNPLQTFDVRREARETSIYIARLQVRSNYNYNYTCNSPGATD